MAGQPQAAQATTEQAGDLPRAFGHYLLFDRIGRGGMAEIFLARAGLSHGASRRVVVKQVLSHLSDDAGFSEMLIAEAKLAAQLRHQNIVQVLDLGVEDRRLYITMEYVEGFDLNQLLRNLSQRQVALPAEFALFIVRETLAALGYAHRATDENGGPLEIVHRDVSPSNVLISFEGEVKLCDFGIARAIDHGATDSSAAMTAGTDDHEEESSRVQRARVAGKSAYMAPEHARGDEIDSRADIFAAGILLWELCAGRRLYKGTEAEMLEMARRGAVRPLPDRGLPRHEKLQAILDRVLAADVGVRYFSAENMLKDLDAYALANGLMASQLKFGAFLMEHFGEEIVGIRRSREQAAEQKTSAPPPPTVAAKAAEATTPTPALPPASPLPAAVVASPTTIARPLYFWVAAAGLAVGGVLTWLLTS